MSTHTNENDPAMPFGQISEQTGQPINGFFAAGLTAREHAAIHLRVPMSGNPWLDAMITEARRWDAAQGIVAVQSTQWEKPSECASYSACFADELTRQMKGGER